MGTFSDAHNIEWKVKVVKKTGTCKMCVPGNDMTFEGDERTSVGIDATTQFMCFTSQYVPSSWVPPQRHGIRIKTEGYTDPAFANDDWKNWGKALAMVKEGAEIAGSLAKSGIRMAGR